eukprot:CAMPEP_0201549808 /NCGR_PEP_ID=MMETSP0173_2-20130828/6245_1 /ASSEMBLY_ACC=CAM_ASM_000268 /TAXON_ID=218659 /ORGANISM="Vexillifera sp., Strain DIVA3 564/2" /LENGTH=53 /DNA_ID=CAMNT_0047959613 /DNA_START=116 /DNA_END=277 /DNA_ORIENTATION=+
MATIDWQGKKYEQQTVDNDASYNSMIGANGEQHLTWVQPPVPKNAKVPNPERK